MYVQTSTSHIYMVMHWLCLRLPLSPSPISKSLTEIADRNR